MMTRLTICLAALMLIAAPAAAQDRTRTDRDGTGDYRHRTSGAYDSLSPGEKAHVDALFRAQFETGHPPRGHRRLSRDDIAEARAHTGWGKLFKDLQSQGYFPKAKNFGEVVSRYRHRVNRLRHAGYGAHSHHRSHVAITTGSGRRIDYRRGSHSGRTGGRDGDSGRQSYSRSGHRDGGRDSRMYHAEGGHGSRGGYAYDGGSGRGIVTGGGGYGVSSGAAASISGGHGNKGGNGVGRGRGRDK